MTWDFAIAHELIRMSKIAIGIRVPACYTMRPLPTGAGELLTETDCMSQHRSLRAAATLGGKRNVMKRFERVALLKKRGQWKDGDRITGLRKTKAEA
jgi:small basic protein (TIGR04137 family)